ncbi:MAG: thiamine phosphate synthase [Nitrospirota bacterium]|nr:thiamine phosphate synthase [Nitrospirota bacterium]
MFPPGLYFIVSSNDRMSPEDLCRAGLEGGARVVQLRMKAASRRRVFETAERLRAMTREAEAFLIINDHADIAAAVEADGVHLGQDDLPIAEARKVIGETRLVGISTHSREQALDARDSGANYIGFGPVFETATKDAGVPRGTIELAHVASIVPIPVVAIGGITRKNVAEVMASGAYSAAVISDIANAPDVTGAVKETVELINRFSGRR